MTARILFSAGDAIHGYELWVTDGTAAGTHLVDDIRPGSYYGSYLYPNVPFGAIPLKKYGVAGAGLS
jgi:ELWxxDGT repeat protein